MEIKKKKKKKKKNEIKSIPLIHVLDHVDSFGNFLKFFCQKTFFYLC